MKISILIKYKNELRDEYLASDIKWIEFLGERLKSIQGEIKINQLLGLEVRYLKYVEEL